MEISVNSIAHEPLNGWDEMVTFSWLWVQRSGSGPEILSTLWLLSCWMHLNQNLQKYLMHLGDELKVMGQSQGKAVTAMEILRTLAPESLNGFMYYRKLTQIISVVGRRNDYVSRWWFERPRSQKRLWVEAYRSMLHH